jgi:hypothetical protein
MKLFMQTDPHGTTSGARRRLKRQTNRAERREGRRHPEEAQRKRRYFGFWS